MEIANIRIKIDYAIKELMQRHRTLLELDVNERAISHKFAEILGKQFCDYDVDCEYNRHHNEVKRVKFQCKSDNPKNVLPDIIIHQRNTDDNNLLVIEIKKEQNSNSQDGEHDRNKLRTFLRPPYNYEYGIFLIFSPNGKYNAEWFFN